MAEDKAKLKKIVKEQAAAVKADPNNLLARLKLAGALKDLGRGDEAVDHYNEVAKAYVASGKLVQAISVYKGILEIKPGDSSTQSALTGLSAKRAEEIQSKSAPRLQQVDGKWVMPVESDVSEEQGTDPGAAQKGASGSRGTLPTPSVLRLPAPVQESLSGAARRARRSRYRFSADQLPGGASAADRSGPLPMPPPLEGDEDDGYEAAPGVPSHNLEEAPAVASLPGLFDAQQRSPVQVTPPLVSPAPSPVAAPIAAFSPAAGKKSSATLPLTPVSPLQDKESKRLSAAPLAQPAATSPESRRVPTAKPAAKPEPESDSSWRPITPAGPPPLPRTGPVPRPLTKPSHPPSGESEEIMDGEPEMSTAERPAVIAALVEAGEKGAATPDSGQGGDASGHVVMTADSADQWVGDEGELEVEEPTSPGPRSYDETIRKSAVGLGAAANAAVQQVRAKSAGIPRRTLVGMALPDHPDLVGGLPDPLPAEAPAAREAVKPSLPAALDSTMAVPTAPMESETLGAVFSEDEEEIWKDLSRKQDGAPDPEEGPQVSAAARKEPQAVSPKVASGKAPLATSLPGIKMSTAASGAEAKGAGARSPATAFPSKPVSATITQPLVSGPAKPAAQSTATAAASSKTPTPAPAGRLEAESTSSSSPGAGIDELAIKLEEIELFRDLSETSREMLKSRLLRRVEKPGTVVVKEGDPGNALFVVGTGKVRVSKKGRDGQPIDLALLGPGAFFGEFALLSDRRRHATVTVAEEATLLEISRKVIADLTKSDPAFGNTLRQFYRQRLLATLVNSAPFFDPLSKEERTALMGRLRFRRVAEDTKIVTEGEPGGGFFLILIGEVEVSSLQPTGGQKVLATLTDGMYFGEMSLLKGGNAVATVTTRTPTELVQLAASEFYRLLSNYPQIWQEVNREAERRELANLQILSGRSPQMKSEDGAVVM